MDTPCSEAQGTQGHSAPDSGWWAQDEREEALGVEIAELLTRLKVGPWQVPAPPWASVFSSVN